MCVMKGCAVAWRIRVGFAPKWVQKVDSKQGRVLGVAYNHYPDHFVKTANDGRVVNHILQIQELNNQRCR
jgi:hypothetical protein